MKIRNLLAMPVGIILVGIAILINRFLPEKDIYDFLEGFLIGLSIILNIYYIIVVVNNRAKTRTS